MENGHRKLAEEVLSAFCQMPVDLKAEINEDQSEDKNSSYVSSDPSDFSGKQPDKDKTPAGEEKKNKTPSAEEAMKLFGGKFIEPD